MVYRNWLEICKIEFEGLRMALSTIDLNTGEGERLVHTFPECFSDRVVQGPIPLSVLRQESFRMAVAAGYPTAGDDKLYSYDVLKPNNIPYIGFDTYGNHKVHDDYPIRPDHIPSDVKFGSIVEYMGTKWVVVENNDSCEGIHIAPLECIDPTA